MNRITCLAILCFFAGGLSAQPVSSFELRYFSDDPAANGKTDFKGETEVFNTAQRIDFLGHYAEFASKFFRDTGFNHMVISEAEARETAGQIKPQPQPAIRKRIRLKEWKWTGGREGLHRESLGKLEKYEQHPDVRLEDGKLRTLSGKTAFTWRFAGQPWRSSVEWKAMVPGNSPTANISTKDSQGIRAGSPDPASEAEAQSNPLAAFIFSESGKIPAAEVGFGADGRFYYTTAGNETVQAVPFETGRWYHFKIEFDLNATQRKQDLVRYNLYIDGHLVADYVPLQRVVTSGVGYAQNFTSIAKINRLTLQAGEGVMVDDLWGVGYQLTGRESYPYAVETFMDETFETLPDTHGWTDPDYEDGDWKEATLPVVHGGERYTEQDLLLRKTIRVGSYDKAYLNIETLDPGGEVWVNGKVAAVVSDRSPQRIDIGRFLAPGRENLIAVKVNHFYLTEDVGEVMPHSSLDFNVGWFAGKMSLDLLPLTSIEHAFMYTEKLGENSATQQLRVRIDNHLWVAFRGRLKIKMHPWFPEESGKVSAEAETSLLLPHLSSSLEIPVEVPSPRLWTPEKPVLYQVALQLEDGSGEIIDDYVFTTGIRTLSQEGGSFRLNGEVSMLNGAQIMGYRAPIEDMIRESRCPPDAWIAREILQIKRMNGNMLRVHVHNWEFPARGVNDPRYAHYADQLGMMLIWCPTAWIRTGRGWGDVDFQNYPAYMEQVINSPSIAIWEVANHTQSFKGRDVSESNIYCEQAWNTLYPVDPSRIISYNSYVRHLHYGNDEGTIDQQGNPIDPGRFWTAPNVTRGNQDSPTGYGKEWSVLRNYPGEYRASFLNSPERAYFNFEHQESMAQPNWNLVRGKPWYRIHSYEWGYDEGSIGRRLSLDEWKESQAWQAFGAWEAMKKMRILDYDGFSWCCLHGGANSVTYKKPLIDFHGHAKLSWHVNKMIFQKTVAGSADVDVVIGPSDRLQPVVINWNPAQETDLSVRILDLNGQEVYRKDYPGIRLEGGRTLTELEGFRPQDLDEGHYFILYELR